MPVYVPVKRHHADAWITLSSQRWWTGSQVPLPLVLASDPRQRA